MRRQQPSRRRLPFVVALVLGLIGAVPASASAEYVTDGGFETALSASPAWASGSSNFGTTFCDLASCGNAGGPMVPRTGTVFAWFGGTSNLEIGSVSQDVTVPAGRPAVLSFWIKTSLPRAGTTLRISVGGVERWAFVEDHATDGDPTGHPYAAYTRIEIPIPGSAFDGTPTPLRFDFVSPGSTDTVNYAIDDVSLVDDERSDASVTITPASGTTHLGEVQTYDVAVANAGPDAAAVSVRAALPSELELVSAGGPDLACSPPATPGDDLVCDAGTLASGASVTGQIEVRAAAVGTANLTLTSEVAAPARDPAPANDSATATLVIEPSADLVASIDAPESGTVGLPIDVAVTARNDGPSPASDVALTTTLPADFTASGLPTECAAEAATVTCDLGTLADGDEATRTLTVVPGAVGSSTLTTTVAATDHDPEPANDRASRTLRLTAAPGPPAPPVPPAPISPPAPATPVATPEPPTAPVCLSERRFTTRLLRGRRGPGLRIPVAPSRGRIVSARLKGPKGWKARKARRSRRHVTVDLRGAPAGRYRLRVRVRVAAAGRSKARTVTVTRTYRTCTPKR